jgi:hypothetical protein
MTIHQRNIKKGPRTESLFLCGISAVLIWYQGSDSNRRPTDSNRVFADGVPRCKTLRKDLKAAEIPYVDETGRYADFHALRYTFNTWLQTNGVPPRMAQELMRHSDQRLTEKVYLDTTLLPLQDCMRGIDGNGPLMQILMQISGETGRLASRVGETGEGSESPGSPLAVGSGRELTQVDEDCDGGIDGTRTRNRMMLSPSWRKGFRL